MPKAKGKLIPILLAHDLHCPYEDKRAVDLMFRVAKDLRPGIVALLGDFSDMYLASNFSKDPNRGVHLDDEVKACNKLLDRFDSLGAAHKVFLAGNHEARLTKYLNDKAPQLASMLQIQTIFNLDKRGWEYVAYKSDTRIGKLYLTHDVDCTGRNSAFKALDTYQHNITSGHTHRLLYVVEGNAGGEIHLSAQFGWMGDITKIDYMQRAQAAKNWALGFGVGYLDTATGNVYVTPIPIVNYTCIFNGKLYKG